MKKKYVADKLARSNPQNQIKWRGNGQSTWKIFRVMIVKMAQNLRNRMEVQIEKIQESFNKDLEVKNK